MKYLHLISFLLFAQVVFAQYSADTTIRKWYLDSLRFELWQKSETINRMRWAYQLKVNTDKVDTIYIRQDSVVINHWTKENTQLYQESVNLRKVSFKEDYYKSVILKRFFNGEGRVVYIEFWEGLCYDETQKDESEIYFDSMLRKIERIIYDKRGQITKKLLYEYQSYRPEQAYEITYWLDNGNQNQTVRKIDRYSFWN